MDRDKARNRPESEKCETPDRWPWFISYKVIAYLESVCNYINRHETSIQFYEDKHTRAEQVIDARIARVEDHLDQLQGQLKRLQARLEILEPKP